ncbi:hypothetical protein EMCRGX_G028458 [Ephydatia muelleri]
MSQEKRPSLSQQAGQINSPSRQMNDAITADQLGQLLVAMQQMSDSLIAIPDIRKTLGCIMGPPDAEDVVEALASKVDSEHTGFVDRGEVCSFVLQQLEEKEAKTTNAIRVPIQQPPKFGQSVHSKEAMCRLMKASTQYFTVSRDGVITSWKTNLHPQRSVTVHGELLSGLSAHTKRRALWITDTVLMPDCNKLVVSTISRELCFYDLTTSLYNCQYKVLELPCAPISLTYYHNLESHQSYLLYGDELGSVTILTFLKPTTALFNVLATKDSTLTYNDLFGQADFVSILEYPQIHQEWTLRVSYLSHNHSFVSCSSCSVASLVMTDVNRHRDSYVFRVRKGVKCFDYSRELDVIATGSADHRVRLWDPYVPSRPMAVLVGHDTVVIDVAMHSQLKVLFSFSHDRVMHVWDMFEHTLLQTVKVTFPFSQRPPDYGPGVVSLPLPHTLILMCNENLARFSIEGVSQPSEEYGGSTSHQSPLCAAVYSPQLNQVISACEGSSVYIWDINTGALVLRCDGCHGHEEVTSLTLDASGRQFITGSRGGDVKVWSCTTGQCVKHFQTSGGTEVTGVLHLKEKGKLLCVGWNRRITAFVDKPEVYELCSDNSWQGKDHHQDDILCMAYCPPHYVATGSFDGEIVVWNLNKERAMARFHSLAKLAPVFLRQHKLRTQRSSSHTSSSTHSRPASRKLSSYRIRSASAHVRYAPVDKLLFLKTRITESCEGVATLVSSEGGMARFWDIHGSGQDLGNFPLTGFEDENVLALTSDPLDQYLIAGDTVGFISVFDIRHYGNCPTQDGVVPDPSWRWKAHDREVVSVDHVSQEVGQVILTASADCNVCLWTMEGTCVGRFGQDCLWNLQHILQSGGTHSKCADVSQECRHTGETPTKGQADIDKGISLAKGDSPAATLPRAGADERSDSGTPHSDVITTRSMLGALYQEQLNRRMSDRHERRVNLAGLDLGPIEQFGAVCSAYQALKIQNIDEMVLPKRT